MFYPANFPVAWEAKLVDLLHILEKSFNHTPPANVQQIQRNILDNWHEAQKPANWWLTFILLRHEEKFSQAFIRKITPFLMKTKTRSISGIVPLSLFTKGVGCPFHCIYCPHEPGLPKSYFSDEPAVMRALRHDFDPYRQTLQRLVMFVLSGHPIDKVEIIIKGGTFSFYPKQYRTWFVKRVFDACNTDVLLYIKTGQLKKEKSTGLKKAQTRNETTTSRIIGINIETRPDYIHNNEISYLRTLGVTHVELGVQILDNEIYTLIKRGHRVEHVVNATKLLKNAGFKVGYHIMPNLPGSTPTKDLNTLKTVFTNPQFKPDYLKLYPTTITKHTLLHNWVQKGTYKPYDQNNLIHMIVHFKSEIAPPWVRIGRLTRDITTTVMEGEKIAPNLREIIQNKMRSQNLYCKCIRCREIKDRKLTGQVLLRTQMYNASEGNEYFLEFIDENKSLLGFLRLRMYDDVAIVRELHVYGFAARIGERGNTKIQHMSLGKQLLLKAASIAQKEGKKQLVVIAGVGARQYYRPLGYALKKTYMVKNI